MLNKAPNTESAQALRKAHDESAPSMQHTASVPTASALAAPPFSFKALYVRILLRILPGLLSIFHHFSRKIQAEANYLEPGYSFMLKVEGTPLACACIRTEKASFARIAPARIASDVEPGSGLDSSQQGAQTIDYVIAFRSLNFAFACFSGSMSLKDALAQRAFSTRGPNNTGVSLTYMFNALLSIFFGWRTAYRAPKRTAVA